LQRVLQHERVEILSRHTVYGRLRRWILFVVIAVDDSLILVLIVDKVEVVRTLGIELDWSIRHISEII
jgi:hypothetical protein